MTTDMRLLLSCFWAVRVPLLLSCLIQLPFWWWFTGSVAPALFGLSVTMICFVLACVCAVESFRKMAGKGTSRE